MAGGGVLMYSAERSEEIKIVFNKLASSLEKWTEKNKFYYDDMGRYLKFLVPENQSILFLGSGLGDLLKDLKPSRGVGIDISPEIVKIAQKRHPRLEFYVGDIEKLNFPKDYFDIIIMTDIIGYIQDIEETLRSLHKFCHEETRLIICYFNYLWEPIIKIAQKYGFAMPRRDINWLSSEDITGLLYLADFELVKEEKRLLIPKKIPIVSNFINSFLAPLPVIKKLCLSEYYISRPRAITREKKFSVSIVIPCKNESGNIEDAIKRLPVFGESQEIIFVEGHSKDNTLDEIKRTIEKYSEKDIKYFVQEGRGKGDAVRKGFAEAKGELLMILDADLTVPPEDLPKFYRALATGKGEFVNGSRLVYPMEKQAMRFLNILGNKLFSLTFTWLLNQRFKDTLCGTKALSKINYQRIEANREYFGDFDPFGDFDLIFGASKLNLKILELPIRYRERTYGSTQIKRFHHGILLARMTLFAFRKLKIC